MESINQNKDISENDTEIVGSGEYFEEKFSTADALISIIKLKSDFERFEHINDNTFSNLISVGNKIDVHK